jgi:hypothetical protein
MPVPAQLAQPDSAAAYYEPTLFDYIDFPRNVHRHCGLDVCLTAACKLSCLSQVPASFKSILHFSVSFDKCR